LGARRVAVLLVALTTGAVAALAAWSYVAGAERRAYGDVQLVKVLVVKGVIPRGVAGERAAAEGMIGVDEIPKRFRPATSVTSVAELQGKVAVSPLSPGQIVVHGAFVDASRAASFAASIPAGQVAITIQVNEVRGVARLIAPGDRVNILVVSGEAVRPLFQNVNVIAVGQTPPSPLGETTADAEKASETQDRSLVTLAVPLLAAERIAMAVASAGEDGLFLTLVPPENEPVAVPPVNAGNLYQGPLSPYA
jgi:pilus assembly protein CpaB